MLAARAAGTASGCGLSTRHGRRVFPRSGSARPPSARCARGRIAHRSTQPALARASAWPCDIAHRTGLGPQTAVARDPRARVDQRRVRHAQALVQLRHALQGRADQGGCRAGALPHRGPRGLGPNPPDQGFLEALNGPFHAAKRHARGFARIDTIRTVNFLIGGKLDFGAANSDARQPTPSPTEQKMTPLAHWCVAITLSPRVGWPQALLMCAASPRWTSRRCGLRHQRVLRELTGGSPLRLRLEQGSAANWMTASTAVNLGGRMLGRQQV